MKRVFSLTGMFFLIAILTASGQTARKYIKAGEEFIRNGLYEDAIDQFSKAIDESPTWEEAYIRRARAYEMTGNFGMAMDDYRRASNFTPGDAGILHNLGRMCNKLAMTDGITPEDRANTLMRQ